MNSEEIDDRSSETNTLDVLFQNESLPSTNSNDNDKIENKRQRSWSEIVENYLETLKPKDVIIFFENVRVFNKSTQFMLEFRNIYFDSILKCLNGGEPLKADFGRDEFTNLYTLFSFTASDNSIKQECSDTAMIYKIMESVNNFNFNDVYLQSNEVKFTPILEQAMMQFNYYDEIRNNHPKRKRYLIFIGCSKLLFDKREPIIEELKEKKVRFSIFSPVNQESYSTLSELLNYNGKLKDLSTSNAVSASLWPLACCNGLSKLFDANSTAKRTRWNGSKDSSCDSTEYDFVNMISNETRASFDSSSFVHLSNETVDSASLSSRSMLEAEQQQQQQQDHQCYNQPNVAKGVQQKYNTMPATPYFPMNSNSQQQPPPSNKTGFYSDQQQQNNYSAPNSVAAVSHRSTPSSITHAQSPQFGLASMMQQHQNANIAEQQISVTDTSGDMYGSRSNLHHMDVAAGGAVEIVSTEGIQQRFQQQQQQQLYSFGQGCGRPMGGRQQQQAFYGSAQTATGRNTVLFEGLMKVSSEVNTHLLVVIDSNALAMIENSGVGLLSMVEWEGQCQLSYFILSETVQLFLFGKTVDGDGGTTAAGPGLGGGKPLEVNYKMSQQAQEVICSNLIQRPNMFGIIRPFKLLQADNFLQILCLAMIRGNLKALIPADPKNLWAEFRASANRPPYSVMYSMQQSIPQTSAVSVQQRQMMNRFAAANQSVSMIPVQGPQMFRNMSHSGFIGGAQPTYILQQNQYSSGPTQSTHVTPIESSLQSGQMVYDQNMY